MVAFRPNKTNERHQTKTETRHDDYDVDLHVFLWDDPHEDILWRKRQVKKKQKQDSLQQKQHNRKSTHFGRAILPMQGANTKSSKNRNNKTEIAHATLNHSQVSSVAISAHCCLHWCSHLTSIPPSCIGVRTLHFSCVPFR